MDKIINDHYDVMVISGFSGSGKGVVLKKLLSLHPELELIKSYTTRTRRNNDTDFYTFTNLEEFMDLVEKGFFLEKNQYAGEWYGTPLHLVRECVANGKIAVVEVDSNGFRQIMDSPYTKHLRILSIFVVADADTIISRLIDRNTENLEKILLRVTSSLAECEQIDQYDMILPNYNINTSVAHIEKALCEGVNPQSTFDAEGYKRRMKEIIELLIE